MNDLLDLLPGQWVSDLARRAGQETDVARIPLTTQGQVIGSVSVSLLDRLRDSGSSFDDLKLCVQPVNEVKQLEINDPVEDAWDCWLCALRSIGLITVPSAEQLSLHTQDGKVIGSVPRSLARWLGIPTHSVHVVGLHGPNWCWVQKRATSKSEDPGMWDTLMGGTVAFGETPAQTLARELWEESGLRLSDFGSLKAAGTITVKQARRLNGESGFQIEHIHCFAAELLQGKEPINQDGEVEVFQLLNSFELSSRLLANAFTLEAACATVQVFRDRQKAHS
jgi:8-oxo-dGTP pyrophosphatase MutT (NUDIX family)